jgi:broad specificity phosphatase PhoE
MSTLLLVRHAQASFLTEDYDRLSPLGVEQAGLLGRALSRAPPVDAVFVGPRRRHVHTAEALLEQLAHSPPLERVDDLDEYPAEEVLKDRLPALLETRPELADTVRDMGHEDRRIRGRAFDLVLQAALRDWAKRERAEAAHESFRAFDARIGRALARVTEARGSGQRVLAVSSGGTIGALVARVLSAPAETALELGFMLNNSAVTEIAFSPGRTGLARFNVVAHLPEAHHFTRR